MKAEELMETIEQNIKGNLIIATNVDGTKPRLVEASIKGTSWIILKTCKEAGLVKKVNIGLCQHYNNLYSTKCGFGLRGGIKCHGSNLCPKYQPSFGIEEIKL